MDKYCETELAAVLTRIDKLEVVRLQFFSFFATATLTMLGFGVSQKNSILIALAGIPLAISIVVDSRIRKQMQIYYYRGIQLQRKLSSGDPEAFLELHTSILAREAKTILIHQSVEERVSALVASKAYRSGIYLWLPMFIIVTLLIAALILRLLCQW